MSVLRHCEVCEQPIPDGQEIVHPEEGDSYCARCVVDLIGGERDALRRQLEGAVDPAEIVAWLRGRTGYGGGFTSADDVADAIERRFITERGR